MQSLWDISMRSNFASYSGLCYSLSVCLMFYVDTELEVETEGFNIFGLKRSLCIICIISSTRQIISLFIQASSILSYLCLYLNPNHKQSPQQIPYSQCDCGSPFAIQQVYYNFNNKMKVEAHGTNVFEKSMATNMLTSLWKKCNTKQPDSASALQNRQKSEPSSSQSEQFSKIVMCKQEFLSFTKKFAISKIDYEQKIEQLTEEVNDKASRIQALSEQVGDLRTQQDYMMRVMEQLRDRHMQEVSALNSRNENNSKAKQAEIEYLKNEIVKIRAWLEQQKIQAKRCMQFLKIKDEIIENLEWEVVKCRNQIQCLKQVQRCHHNDGGMINYLSSTLSTMKISQNIDIPVTARKRTNSNKKIIIRKQKRDENTLKQNRNKISVKQKHQSNNDSSCFSLKNKIDQLETEKNNIENQKCQLYGKVQELLMENQMLRRAQQILEKEYKESSKIKKSISELDEITRRIKDSQIDKDSMWAIKCTFLERQVEQLTKQLLIQHKKGKSSCVLEFSKDFTPADQQMHDHEPDLMEDPSEEYGQ